MPKGIAKNPEKKAEKIRNSKLGKKRPDLSKRNFENNPMDNPETRLKMRKTMKENYINGKMVPSRTKGLKLKEIFGEKKADEIRKKIRENTNRSHLIGDMNPSKRLDVRDKLRLSKLREKNPSWNNGSSFKIDYSPNFGRIFKRAIRKRDNYVCIKCGKHQEKENRSLSVHHINYDKKLTIPQNCCSLCRKCHSEVNFNRLHWTKFFQSLLSEKYGYQYSNHNEILLDIKNEM
jgi:hypothetical protein